MANTKKFVAKNGLLTQNVQFDSTDGLNTINVSMVNGDTLTFNGDTGQLFSITDSQTGTIFSVNDISGVPSIEVLDDGTVRLAEIDGNVLIGTTTDDGINRLQVEGDIAATSFKGDGSAVTGIDAGNVSTGTVDEARLPANALVGDTTYTAGTGIDLSGTTFSLTDERYTTAEKSKLSGIATGAEVNVQSDWNAGSGDAFIKNKPTLGTAASTSASDYATAAQGTNADTAYGWGDHSVVGYESASNKGQAGGYAELDGAGKVPTTQLPSFVDDVEEYADLASFPATGETGKMYVALDTNKVYRWGGSSYVYITSGAVDSVDGRTGVISLSDLYEPKNSNIQSHIGSTSNPHGVTKSQVGLGNVDNTSDISKPISTAQQAALDDKLDSSAYTAADVLAKTKSVDGSGSGLDADTLDGYQADEFQIISSTNSKVDLATGWYTIATNSGNRAIARFGVRDTDSSDHQSCVFYASHHFGSHSELTVLHSGRYNGSPLGNIRIKEGGTYDGAMLQVYIDQNANSTVTAYLYGENFQSSGWTIKDWIPDGTDPGGVSNFAALTNTAAQINLDNILDGGMATTGELYLGGNTTQYKAWHAGNDGSGSGLDADTVDGQHASAFAVSGHTHNYDNYQSWNISDGTNSESIGSGNTLTISGTGATSASYDSASNTLTIDSTDTNTDTTYSAGTGITLSGTTFSLTDESYTATEKNKLAGIAAGAEVNVQADWNATSGDAMILNKPTIGGGSVTVSDTAPTSPQNADLWWDSSDGNLYVYYDDGTSSQWATAVTPISDSLSDADTLDGIDSTGFALASHSHLAGDLPSTIMYDDQSNSMSGDLSITKTDATINVGSGSNTGTHGLAFYDSTGTVGISQNYDTSTEILSWNLADTTSLMEIDKNGQFTTTSIVETSSIRYKENLEPISDALSLVNQLQGYTYDRKDGSVTGEPGFIAEEVNEIIPNVVTSKNGDIEGLNYTKFSTYLVEAVKELNDEVKRLRKEVEELKNG